MLHSCSSHTCFSSDTVSHFPFNHFPFRSHLLGFFLVGSSFSCSSFFRVQMLMLTFKCSALGILPNLIAFSFSRRRDQMRFSLHFRHMLVIVKTLYYSYIYMYLYYTYIPCLDLNPTDSQGGLFSIFAIPHKSISCPFRFDFILQILVFIK